jgi:hypothetical protein
MHVRDGERVRKLDMCTMISLLKYKRFYYSEVHNVAKTSRLVDSVNFNRILWYLLWNEIQLFT